MRFHIILSQQDTVVFNWFAQNPSKTSLSRLTQNMSGWYSKNIILLILSQFFVMLILLFCKLSEQYSQTDFPILKTKPYKVTKYKMKQRMADI